MFTNHDSDTITAAAGDSDNSMVNVVWASEWDECANEATGEMHDLGQRRRVDAWEAILDAHLTADQLGWKGGNAYLTDGEGHLILLTCDDADVTLDAPTPADDEEDDDEDPAGGGGDWDGCEDDDYGDFDADAEYWPVENTHRDQGYRPFQTRIDPNPTIPEWRPPTS